MQRMAATEKVFFNEKKNGESIIENNRLRKWKREK